MELSFLNYKYFVTSGLAENEAFRYCYTLDFQNKQLTLTKKYMNYFSSQYVTRIPFTDVSASSNDIGILAIPPYDYWMIKTGGELFVNLSDDNFAPSRILDVSYSNGVNPSSHFLEYDTLIGYDQDSVAVSLDYYRPPGLASNIFYRPCYVTFHYDEVFDKSYVYFYINPLYVSATRTSPDYIRYEVYKVPLSIKYTNCCLKQCFSPTKYIYYKG